MIVEEDSNYPSFLYSVWAPLIPASTTSSDSPTMSSSSNGTVEIKHVLYIASQSRMVEAIITGIVNGIYTGGGWMDLLLQFSEQNPGYVLNGETRSITSPAEIMRLVPLHDSGLHDQITFGVHCTRRPELAAREN